MVIAGLGDDQAAALGRDWGQAAVVRLDGHGVHVVPTGMVDVDAVSLPGWDRACVPQAQRARCAATVGRGNGVASEVRG